MIYKPVLLLFLLWVPVASSFSQTDSLLQELSQAIENKEVYVGEKQDQIERLQSTLTENNLSLLQQLTYITISTRSTEHLSLIQLLPMHLNYRKHLGN